MKTQLNTNYTCKLVASPRWQEQQRQQGAAARTANKQTNKQKKVTKLSNIFAEKREHSVYLYPKGIPA